MRNFEDLTGYRFSRLVVVGLQAKGSHGSLWSCACDCGSLIVTEGSHLRSGHTKSCGCLRRCVASFSNLRHGDSHRGSITSEYRAWKGAKARCFNRKSPDFQAWGGRGITMCQRWKSNFSNFLSDMGRKPSPAHSLDRIDNDGDYEPGNCRWATPKQQSNNSRPRSSKNGHLMSLSR
jgi:hypothetical protein